MTSRIHAICSSLAIHIAIPLWLFSSGCAKQDAPIDDGPADLTPVPPTDGGSLGQDLSNTATRTALFGSVTRTAKPMNGGKGNLYVAVFEGNPVVDAKNARLLGQKLIPDVDFTDMSVSIPYRIDGILAAQRPTQVLAFLDDNHTASTQQPGPDAGDLVTLEGLGGIKVTLMPDQDNSRDLVLNAIIPKL